MLSFLHLCYMVSLLMLSVSSFSHSVVSDSLWPHGLWHARSLCPSPTPGACSNSRPLSRWCHPTISSSVVPFSPCLQSFTASGSFPMSQFFASGGQSIGVAASVSVLPTKSKGSVSITFIRIKAVAQSLNYITQLMTLSQMRRLICLIVPSNWEKW